MFAYCGNNPVNRIDISGADSESISDIDLTNDVLDEKENGKSTGPQRTIPTRTGTTTSRGTVTKKGASNHGGKWPTVRRNHWKAQAVANPQATGELSSSGTYKVTQENINLMSSGKAPYGTDGKKVQLHHPYGIVNNPYSYYEILATDHWRNYKALHLYLFK